MELLDIKGIGEKTKNLFNRLSIFTAEDLLYYYPRDYEYYSEPKQIIDLKVGNIETVKVIISSKVNVLRRGKLNMTYVTVSDDSRKMKATWFNIPYISKYLNVGRIVVLRGRVIVNKSGLTINQPKIYEEEDYNNLQNSLFPIYPLTKGLSNELVRKSVKEILNLNKDNIVEYLPKSIREKRQLAEINYALERIHFPSDYNELVVARRRLVYDEFLMFNLGIKLYKNSETKKGIKGLQNRDRTVVNNVITNLKYKLTKDQNATISDIFNDFDNCKLMNRLVQGDVGSGKTIVAFIAMLYVALADYQAVMMAPTEVLASQHYENLKNIIKQNNLDIEVAFLSASLKKKERTEVLKNIKSAKSKIIIGTHAVFSEDIEYDNLSLIVTDEQHRFGVNQRKAIEDKSELVNVLVMSATPIPRTLAMLLYADMDISLIKEKPQNRLPIKNAVISEDDREKAYKKIKTEIENGHQAYVICASIESNAEEMGNFLNLQNVIEYADKIKKYFSSKTVIEVLHGKMKNELKDEIMTRFKNGEIDILVSTTVVEVGVDCPNATVIMIEDAGRFGLASLHQLRGRVGRGDSQSYAIFVDTTLTENSKNRLEVLKNSNDGFYIAEEDLKMRGPGDIFGVRQSGSLDFKLADLYTDANVLREVAEDVSELLKADKKLNNSQNRALKSKIDNYIKKGYTI